MRGFISCHYGRSVPSNLLSSSSWMMILGVTINIKLSVVRAIPTFLNKRLTYGTFERIGTPYSFLASCILLTPPINTVPPSGTLTVVVTEVMRSSGCCIVVPLELNSCSAVDCVWNERPGWKGRTPPVSACVPCFSSLLFEVVDRCPSN